MGNSVPELNMKLLVAICYKIYSLRTFVSVRNIIEA